MRPVGELAQPGPKLRIASSSAPSSAIQSLDGKSCTVDHHPDPAAAVNDLRESLTSGEGGLNLPAMQLKGIPLACLITQRPR